MKPMVVVIISDFKLIFRDPSLRIFLIAPFAVILVVNFLLPHIIGLHENAHEYLPYIIMGAVMQTSTMFAFVYCMVFIDEKDTKVASVYGVLPISKIWFIIFRLFLAFLFSVGFTFLLLYFQPFYLFSKVQILFISVLAGIVGPWFALTVSNLSNNKMAGMTWYKLINLLIMLPILSFFVPAYSKWFAVIPTHWIFQGINNIIIGSPFLLNFFIGGMYSIILIFLLTHYFSKNHFI